eukprot:Nk52_evm18s248 gene=Nk52_evmTU18s248
MNYDEMNHQKYFSKVELSVSCKNLVDLDTFSKSDPVCVLFLRTKSTWKEIGRTEIIWDNLNPEWEKTFHINYVFEEVQELKFEVYDAEGKTNDLSKYDFIGASTMTLSSIMVSPGQVQRKPLQLIGKNKDRGVIVVHGEEVQDLAYTLHFQFSGLKLDKKDFFGKSDPFLEFQRSREDGSFQVVYRTEVIKKTLNPNWKPFSVLLQQLSNGDNDRPLKVVCKDWNRSGDHDLIGHFNTSIRELVDGGPGKRHALKNEKLAQKKKKYTDSGTILVNNVKMVKEHTFLDYLVGGVDMNLVVAIDFTASNGDPMKPSSLHYCNRNTRQATSNDYATAIESVANVLLNYDSDKLVPVYGFGARLPPNGQVSHCFPLSGKYDQPEVLGLDGILQSYYQALENVTLYGPTLFSTILRTVNEMASVSVTQQHQQYFILLIITDGVINDMEQTIEEIVKGSGLPLSIVVVGVGNADFTDMNILDADDVPLKNRDGKLMSRDIVQFVPLNEFKNKMHSGGDFSLAREVLEEIPEQLLSYMKTKGIVPNQPRSATHTMSNASAPPAYPPAP